MTRPFAVAIIVILIVAGWFAVRTASNQRTINEKWREAEAKARVVKAEIDQRFPVGTAQSEVRDYLQQRFGGYGTGNVGRTYRVGVEDVPNRYWLTPCGSWNIGVEMTFEAGKLFDTQISSFGNGCL
jgi:hypothetical protein